MTVSEPVKSTTGQDEQKMLFIAVMGPTGTGKTSLINLLSGSDLRIGTELESCTSEVQISEPFQLDGHQITLIDTPGFDDTKLSDTSVLNMIAAYLSYSHASGKNLAGVIYMHRILDNRVGGIAARNFRMFRNLCGEGTLRNVVITTTMWDQVEESLGEEREQELARKDAFFKPALEKGARLARHSNTLDSAHMIIRSLLQDKASSSVTLQIQEELSNGLDISETSAGKELSRELFEQMSRHREEIRGIMIDMQEAIRARDEESRKELVQERARMESLISRLQTDSANLVRGYQEALTRLEERFRTTEASAAAAAAKKLAFTEAGKQGNKAADESGYPGQQTHSPIVQAVAATENSNAILEAKLAAAIPVVGFWGKLAIMLAPFSLTWR